MQMSRSLTTTLRLGMLQFLKALFQPFVRILCTAPLLPCNLSIGVIAPSTLQAFFGLPTSSQRCDQVVCRSAENRRHFTLAPTSNETLKRSRRKVLHCLECGTQDSSCRFEQYFQPAVRQLAKLPIRSVSTSVLSKAQALQRTLKRKM